MSGIANWQAQIRIDIEDLKKRIKVAEGEINNFTNEDRKVKLDIDTKTLESAIQKLDKMLDSLGKGTGDFKQFENLSKELLSIVSEVKSLSKAFGKVDDSGAKTLLSSIQNIDKSLSELNQNILNVNKNMSNMGGNTSGAVKQVENISNAYQDAAKEAEKLADAQSKIGQKTNISSGSAIEQQIKQQDKLQDEIRETIALTNEYGEVIDVYRGTHGLIGNGNVSNRYHGGTFWTSNRKLATQSYADGNKVTHANLYMRNPYLVHGGGADWDQLTLSIKQGEELEKHLENVYASINDVFSKIQDTSGIEAGHLFDVFDGQLNFTDFENGIQKPIESLKDFQNIFESIDYDNSKIPQVQNYINQLYDLFTSYSRISQLSEKGVLNTNEVVEIAKALKYDGVVFNGIRDGSDDSSDIFVTFEEKQSKVIDMITAAQLRVEEEQQLANILVNTKENLYKTLKSLDSKQVDEFIDKSAFNFVTDGSYMENLGEVLGKADPTDSIDNIKNKIREYINEVVNEFENAQKQIADSTEPTKDAFPDKDVSASVESATNSIKEENNVLEQNTQKVKENTQAKEQNANIDFSKYDKRLDSYNGKIDKYKTTIDRFNNGGWTSDAYLKNVQAVKNAVDEYETLLKELKGKDASLVTSDDISKLDEYEKKIKDTIATVTNMSAAEKGYSQLAGQKEIDKINKILRENSAMSSEAKAKIKAYKQELISGNPSASLEKIHGEIMKIVNAEELAGRAGRSFFDTLKNSGFHQLAAQMAGMFGFYDVINLGKEGLSVVRELNTALTEMRKVSDESLQSLKNYQNTTFDVADAVGTTAKQIQTSTADYMRLGESLDEAAESAKTANALLNVSEFDNIEDATKSLVAMGQAYKDLDKMTIVDKLNEVGNNYAISTDELATALQKSAATLSLMGNTIDEAASLVTTANATIQDADSVSAGLRTISLRLVGTEEAEEELSAMNEEVDAFVKATNSKKQQIIKDYTAVASNNYQGFDILDNNGNYKNTYEILLGIAKVYKEIQEQDKKLGTNHATALIEELAGKNRSNIASAILQDPTQLEAVKKSSEEALGSAEKELNSYLDSIDGKMAQLENRAQEFWFKVIDSETIKNGIDLLSALLKGATDFVDTIGLLPTIFTTISGYLGSKNLGWQTRMTLWCDAQYMPRAEVRILG